jgi:hypothetical protein
MPNYQSQEFLFQRIKELLPPHVSLVDTVANILNVSSDSAYRRIRGETPLVLDEARELCQYLKISLDQVLNVQSGSTLFRNVRLNTDKYNYIVYLKELVKRVQLINSFVNKEIIYRTKDMPIFHNFYYQPMIAFRYFFWMKTMIQHPDFSDKGFTLDCVSPEIENLSKDLTREYNKTPSVEIWNTECVNALLSQIEFYKDTGNFSSSADIKVIYEALQATLDHIKSEVEYGSKYMPDENPESMKNNFRFFYNRVMLGETTVTMVADSIRTVIINYDALNYIETRDESFCELYYEDMQSLMKKSTIISQTSEKQRNIFFSIMQSKVKKRLRML